MLLLLAACTPDPEDTAKAGPPPADPFVGITLATGSGSLKSTCEVTLTIRNEDDSVFYDGAINGQGREWLGSRIEPGSLYTATAAWDDCSNTDGGTGSMDTASAISADAGTLLMFHYNGIDAQFDTMTQDVDFVGGEVDVELAAGTDGAALGSAAGVTEDVWAMNWDDATPIGEVLMLLSYDDSYVEGSPVWLGDPPNWW
jgi:hypothetical protein